MRLSNKVYRHYDANEILLYVGVSKDHLRRLSQHHDTARWYDQIAVVTVETFQNRQEAEEAEDRIIERELPIYNIRRPRPLFRDPNNQSSVLQTNEDRDLQRIGILRKRSGADVIHDVLRTNEDRGSTRKEIRNAFLLEGRKESSVNGQIYWEKLHGHIVEDNNKRLFQTWAGKHR